MSSNDEVVDSSYRWVLLAGAGLLYACFSLLHFSTASLAANIIQDLGLSLSGMGTIMGAWPLVYIFLSIPTGLLLDRFGVHYVFLFGICMIALSAWLRARAFTHAELFFAVFVFGLGAPCISIGTPKLIREWFSYRQRGFALGICTTLTALGSITGLTLSQELLLLFQGSWRSTLLVYAVICTVAAFAWLLIILHPLGHIQSPQEEKTSLKQIWPGCKQLIQSPPIQLVLLLSVGIFFYMHATINWLPKILTYIEPGMSIAESAYWAALPVVCAIMSSAIISRLSDGGREAYVLALLFIAAALACTSLNFSGFSLVLIFALVLLGLVRGGLPPSASLLLIHMPDINRANTGLAVGLFFAIGQIGGVLGPIVFGFLADLSGGFDLPLYCLAAFSVLLALICYRLGKLKEQVITEAA